MASKIGAFKIDIVVQDDDDDNFILPDSGPTCNDNNDVKTEIKCEPDIHLDSDDDDDVEHSRTCRFRPEVVYLPDSSATAPVHECACCKPKPVLVVKELPTIPDSEKYAELKKMLPSSFKHAIKKEYSINEQAIDVILFANIFNEAEAKNWINELENKTRTTFKITSTPKTAGAKIIFKQYRHCHHKTRSKSVNSVENRNRRNTNCPAKLSITIRRELKKEKGRDTHVRGMPCAIYLFWKHNHPTESSDVLRFRPVSEEVKKKLVDLFNRGYSAVTARNAIKLELQRDHPSDFAEYLADRYHYPDYLFCQHAYTKLLRKQNCHLACDEDSNDVGDFESKQDCEQGQGSTKVLKIPTINSPNAIIPISEKTAENLETNQQSSATISKSHRKTALSGVCAQIGGRNHRSNSARRAAKMTLSSLKRPAPPEFDSESTEV